MVVPHIFKNVYNLPPHDHDFDNRNGGILHTISCDVPLKTGDIIPKHRGGLRY